MKLLLFFSLLILVVTGGTAVVTVPFHTNGDWLVKTAAKLGRVSVKYGRSYGSKPLVFARIQVG